LYKLYGGGPEVSQTNRSISNSPSDSDKSSEPTTADTVNRSEANDSLRASRVESLKSPKRKTNFYLKPVGMTNESFYCYMNSCLQGILSIGELAQYIDEERYREAVTNKTHKFWKGINEVVIAHNKRGSDCTPKSIRRLAMNTFDPDEQHDAHEFLRFLLSGMQDEMNLSRPKKEVELTDPDTSWAYYRKYNVSIVDELFAGQLVNRVLCTSCNHVSTTFDPFLDLSLPITPGKTNTIDDCLEAFQKEEEIKDSYVCEKCKSKSKVLKRLVVNRFPKYLVIHLKRFQTYPRKKKIIDQIGFPVETWNVKKIHEKENYTYTLIGSIVHKGSFDSGHYVCFSKRGGEWILCDDESTRSVSIKEVANKEAYVLIYERKN
jgi:ubiquitin C-terminal hydrolase